MAITLTDSKIKKKLSQFSGHIGKHPYFDIDLDEDRTSKKSSKKSVLHSKRIKSSDSRILPPVVKITPKNDHYTSSTPLAAQIYKANSDEFNRKRVKKKVKKSVLTLPNQRTARPQDHTVSDTNDSDYAQKSLDFLSKKVPLECEKASWSSKEDNWHIKRNMKHTRAVQSPQHLKRRSKQLPNNDTSQLKPQNIWGVLRSINRFQFPRSPPLSDADSDKTKKGKGRNNLNYDSDDDVDMDSEIYGVDIEIKSKSSEYSRDSSYGTTVIETGESNKKFSKQPKVSFKERTSFASKIPKQLNKPISYLNKPKKEAHPLVLSQSIRKNETEMLKEHKSEIHYRTEASKEVKDGSKSPRINKYSVITAMQDTIKERLKKTTPRPVIKIKPDPTQIRNFQKVLPLVTDRKSLHEPKSLGYVDQHLEEVSNNCEVKAVPDIKWSQFDTKSNSRINLRENKKVDKEKPPLKRPPMRANLSSPTTKSRPIFTVPEIKRKLELTRFPIVVTDKNEVSSGFQVFNYDQFHGIDEKIWPFMIDWINRKKSSAKSNVDQSNAVVKSNALLNKTRSFINDNAVKNMKDNKDSKRNARQAGKENQNVTTIATMRQGTKKPIHKLRDDMLRVLYKNSSVGYYIKPHQMDMLGQNIGEKCIQSKFMQPKSLSALMPPGANKMITAGSNQKSIAIKNTISNQRTNSPDYVSKYAKINEESPRAEHRPRRFGSGWPKTSWASDFIETVISKIKKGIYCTSESITAARGSQQGLKENINTNVSIQTPPPLDYRDAINEVYESDNDDDMGQFYDAENDPLKEIDGFDKAVSDVELRSITKDKIVMKSFIANVVLHFDVVLALNKLKVDQDLDYIPVGKTESHTKIVKCSTSIVNAVLPAQLCAMIPSMIKGLKELSDRKQFEIMSFENPNSISPEKPELPSIEMAPNCTALTVIGIAPKHAHLVNGIFAPKPETKSKMSLNLNDIIFHDCKGLELARELRISNIDLRNFVFADLAPLLKLPLLSAPPAIEDVPERATLSEPINTCKALVLYNPLEHSLVRLVGWETITKPLKILYDHFKHKLSQQRQDISSALARREELEEGNVKETEQLTQDKAPILKIKTPIKKMRHRRYKKMYRKCKLSAAINNKVNSTELQNISNTGDFFKCLGSGKECLANAFDSPAESLLMSYLAQAKTWISEITPNQSLLLLLLANKKQTANLVRFSQIVVQAIAVNRITKSSELDMEIEVIEKERFNPIAELNEITSSTSIAAARKNLYDELVWIAKTTAADHQRPFDETSEKHLTTLLDKRKNLNPSYLRVMARYVGLGLLKTTKKPA